MASQPGDLPAARPPAPWVWDAGFIDAGGELMLLRIFLQSMCIFLGGLSGT